MIPHDSYVSVIVIVSQRGGRGGVPVRFRTARRDGKSAASATPSDRIAHADGTANARLLVLRLLLLVSKSIEKLAPLRVFLVFQVRLALRASVAGSERRHLASN